MTRVARSWAALGILGLLAGAGSAQEAPPKKLEFRIAPDGWGGASRTFPRYLGDWSHSTPEKHRDFVAKVAAVFDVTMDR